MTPLVSVILPNYNHSKFLIDRINSILNQSYSNIEVIILDDKSTDDSLNTINLFSNNPKVKGIITNDINSGSTFKQWLKGIDKCSGDFIWIAESDDAAEEDFLQTMIQKMLNHENVVLGYCGSKIIDENGKRTNYLNYTSLPNIAQDQRFSSEFVLKGGEFIQELLLAENNIPNASAVLFRKSALRNNYINSILDFKLYGDWYFWILLAQKGDVYFTPALMNNFRIHENTVRKQKSKQLATFFENINLYIYLINFYPDKKRILSDRLIFKYCNYFRKEVSLNEAIRIHLKLWKIDRHYAYKFIKSIILK